MPISAIRAHLPPLPFKPHEFGLPIVTSMDSYSGPRFSTADLRYQLFVQLTAVPNANHTHRYTVMECDPAGLCIHILCATDDEATLLSYLSGPFHTLIVRRPPISFEFNDAQVFNPFFRENSTEAVSPAYYGFFSDTPGSIPAKPLPDGSQILITNPDGTGVPVSPADAWLRLRSQDGVDIDAHLIPSPAQIPLLQGVATDRHVINHFHRSAFSGAQWWDRLFDFERQAYRALVSHDLTDQLRTHRSTPEPAPAPTVHSNVSPTWRFLDSRLLALDATSRPGNAITSLLNDVDTLLARHPGIPPEEASAIRAASARTSFNWFHYSLTSSTHIPHFPPASVAA